MGRKTRYGEVLFDSVSTQFILKRCNISLQNLCNFVDSKRKGFLIISTEFSRVQVCIK